MILKGNQRAYGQDLATHLLNAAENEKIELAELRGTIATDLHGAFAEIEAISKGTRARQPFYSLSINPAAPLSREQYFEAIERIETKLGLSGQPRAVIFHEKEGRAHCHVVWSRIDGERLRAVHMAHDRRKLCDVACELGEKFGHDLPPGLEAWKKKGRFKSDRLKTSFAEEAQARRTGITAEQRRDEITGLYQGADSAAAFQVSLEEKGYVLAKGDRRNYVIIDQSGDVHSLSRYVKGVKAKEIKARLASLDPASLPSVDQAKELAAQRRAALADRAREEEQRRRADQEQKWDDARQYMDAEAPDPAEQEELAWQLQLAKLEQEQRAARDALAQRQARRRLDVTQDEQALLMRQADERLRLDAAHKAESRRMLFRLRSAVAGLIEKSPALRSVLGSVQRMSGLDPARKQALEQAALARRHAREKRGIKRRHVALDKVELREQRSLARKARRARRIAEGQRRAALAAQAEKRRRQERYPTDPRLLEDGALAREFWRKAQSRQTEQAGEKRGAQDAAPTDRKLLHEGAISREFWKKSRVEGQAESQGEGSRTGRGPRHRRRPKGYGYRRGED